MKLAVCLHGHYRTFDKTRGNWESILNSSDVYFHTWDTISSVSASHWKQRNDIVNKLDTSEINTLNSFNPKVLIIDKQEWTENDHSIRSQSNMPLKAWIYMWYGVYVTLNEIKKSGEKYDSILIGRYDILINKTLPNIYPQKGTFITTEHQGLVYKQYTDAIIFIDSDDIEILIEFYHYINTIEFQIKYISHNTPEQLFNEFIQSKNITMTKGWYYSDAPLIR